MVDPVLYKVMYKGKPVYYAYRLDYALDFFNHNKCDRLYIYTKDLFPAKALLLWK